jgi:hypothetical protein
MRQTGVVDEPLPSQILMPASLSGIEDVLPSTNQRSSAITARVKTRFVVRSGRMGTPSRFKLNLRGFGAKIE